jgi:hypothetical protein
MECELKAVYRRSATELRCWPIRCNGNEEWNIADRGKECEPDLQREERFCEYVGSKKEMQKKWNGRREVNRIGYDVINQ